MPRVLAVLVIVMPANPAGQRPALSKTGRPADIRVSKTVRHRLAFALTSVSGLPLSQSRAVVASRLADGQTVSELEAYLRATYKADPVGVTAVRNVTRSRGGLHVASK